MQLTRLSFVPTQARRWIALSVAAIALGMILGTLGACSTPPKPKCPVAKAVAIKAQDKWYFIFDQENADLIGLRMGAMVAGLCDGSGVWATTEAPE